MKHFLITLFAVIIGGIILMFLPIVFFLSAAIAFTSSSPTEVENKSVLVLDLTEPIVDYDNSAVSTMLRNRFSGSKSSSSLNDILDNLASAAEDSRISALLIEGDYANCDLAVMNELRRAVSSFKETSGKPVIFYSNSISTSSLYVGSVADSVLISPSGVADLHGLSVRKTFFLKLAEKVGLNFDVIKHGKYKSAVEPYFRTDMSPEDREQTQRYVDVIWSDLRDSIALSRGIDNNVIDNYVDSLNYIGWCDKAVTLNMVDRTAYRDEVNDLLRHITHRKSSDAIPVIPVSEYVPTDLNLASTSPNKLAVVYASGEIYDGSDTSDPENIYGDDLSQTLRKLRLDPTVKAVILRVNSPGGSAAASDIIWREVNLTSHEKPIIVSMGAYAASGGYYISCAANHIVAEPTTLTGSIGVLGVVPNVEKLLATTGVNIQSVSTSKNPVEVGTKALSPAALAHLHQSIEQTYNTFVNRVANGRHMTYEAVDNIASGRVWTGSDALNVGLVDALGGIDDAIDQAIELTGLDDYDIVAYPQPDDDSLTTLLQLGMSVKTSIGHLLFGDDYETLSTLHNSLQDALHNPKPQIQTICDFEVSL